MRDALGRLQSVLVLGGTSEIALASVAALDLVPGARVVLAGRDTAALTVAGATLPAGLAVHAVTWDAARPGADGMAIAADADAVVAAAVLACGGDLDLVIAAAGVLGDQQAAERDTATAVAVLQVNFVGVAAACLAVARRLRLQGHGTLAVLSSVAAVRARRDTFVYGSSKAGLDAFASGLADALHGSGARVVVVRPGFVHTRMTRSTPVAPLATTPGVVGAAVAAAVRSGRPQTYVPWALGPLFAGLRSVPRSLWRRISAAPTTGTPREPEAPDGLRGPAQSWSRGWSR